MAKSAYITKLGDKNIEIHLAQMSEVKYTVIIIREANEGSNIAVPTLYLSKAPREQDEVFLKTEGQDAQAINDMLEREGIVELQDHVIETDRNGYAQVAKLTDKAIQIRDGYVVRDTGKPDQIPDSEFDEGHDEDHKHLWTPKG